MLLRCCSAVALFGLFIKIEQNEKIVKLTLIFYFCYIDFILQINKIFNGADIRGTHSSSCDIA